jgi:hypothetical protein
MRCPNCETTLAMSERLGVEIDYCPECRGVWLDRGEIDRLLEAERVPARASAPTEPAPRLPRTAPVTTAAEATRNAPLLASARGRTSSTSGDPPRRASILPRSKPGSPISQLGVGA